MSDDSQVDLGDMDLDISEGGAGDLGTFADAAEGLDLEQMEGTSVNVVDTESKMAEDLEAVFDVPVRVSAVLGRTKMPVSDLLQMDVGTVVELDRQIGEAIDILINGRLVARGEIVIVDDKLGVTMTEILKNA